MAHSVDTEDLRPGTRRRILEATYLLCQSQPIQAVSIREIAAASGFTPRTIYKHFAAKEELFHVLLTVLMENKGDWLFDAMDRQPDPLGKLVLYSTGNYRYLERFPAELKIVHFSQTMEYCRENIRAPVLEEHGQRRMALYRRFEAVFKAGIQFDQLLPGLDIPYAQDLMTATYRQIAYLTIILGDRPYEYYRAYIDHYLRSLCTESGLHRLLECLRQLDAGELSFPSLPDTVFPAGA